jgi:Na+-transporting methylmalonyl-CoA/oxaloacetate decarboxylase gamma subunit
MNFTLIERLQLLLALTTALTTTVAGLTIALLVLSRLAFARVRAGRRSETSTKSATRSLRPTEQRTSPRESSIAA